VYERDALIALSKAIFFYQLAGCGGSLVAPRPRSATTKNCGKGIRRSGMARVLKGSHRSNGAVSIVDIA